MLVVCFCVLSVGGSENGVEYEVYEVWCAGGVSVAVGEIGGVLVVFLDGWVVFEGDGFSVVEEFPCVYFVQS